MAAKSPPFTLPKDLEYDKELSIDGLKLLGLLPQAFAAAAFFDPQYRGVLDKLAYGNEGVKRGRGRSSLAQMDAGTIRKFVGAIDQVLKPSGHLFLWVDKFHLVTGIGCWLAGTSLETVDLITWDKQIMGMGYRTRRASEHLVVLQKPPKRAKGVWSDRSIRDVVSEKAERGVVHRKPVELQARLIAAVTKAGDVVVDPAAGSFSVLDACKKVKGRWFIGGDLAPR